MTVREALLDAEQRMAAAGCDTPRLDAEVLLAHALGCTRADLVMRSGDELPCDDRFSELVARRVAREPVAYITGAREFRRLRLTVDRRVLIPRPETELLVEVGLSLSDGVSVADVGTGSGAVALALKDERPDLEVVGIDASDDALSVARENASALGLEVEFRSDDLLTGGSDYDAVLANLPYVAEGDPLPPEVAEYEPAGALRAGADGLDVVRRLVGMINGVGVIALEIGIGQADAVTAMVRDVGFEHVERLRDLAGHERVVVGRR